jgi:hypothetical protein
MTDFASAGSQRWIQVAVNRHPDLLLASLQRSGAVRPTAAVHWTSPLKDDGFREYRDHLALEKAGIRDLPVRELKKFWPARGPVWDAIGRTSDGRAVFVEAKAHVPEAASPGCRASERSLALIRASLAEARRAYAPKAGARWDGTFYQYANRLALQYLVNRVNGVPSVLVFLYFVNDEQMSGPASELEWKGAVRLLHAALGLPSNLEAHGVFDAFVDVRNLNEGT